MTTGVRLSIVVPVYNAFPYLAECARSIVSQDVAEQDFEVVFVDDGSTDGSGPYLDELAASHGSVRVFHRENSGTPAAPRNFGLEAARGDYVFFADADDWFYPHAFANMLAHADESGCDLGLFKVNRKEWSSDYSGLFECSRVGCTLEDAPLLSFMGPYRLYKRSLLMDNGIRFPLNAWAEDQPFALACYFAARNICVFSDQDYYHYRRRDDGLSATLGGLSSGFDSWDAAYRGCAAYFEVADRHTCVESQPFVYRRGLESVGDVLVRFAQAGSTFGQEERFRALLAPYYRDETRALLSCGRLLALDALMFGDERAVLAMADFAHSRVGVVPLTDGACRFVDERGGALFETRFPPAELVRMPLASPRLSRARIEALDRGQGESLSVRGDAVVFCADSHEVRGVRLRLHDREAKTTLDFGCATRFSCAGRLFAHVSVFSFSWEVAASMREAAGLLGDAATATLDLHLALLGREEAFREVRLGSACEPRAREAFLAARQRIGSVLIVPVVTSHGNFSLRLFDRTALFDAVDAPRVVSAVWNGSTLELAGTSRWPLDELEVAEVRLVGGAQGDTAMSAALALARNDASENNFQAWSARLDLAPLGEVGRDASFELVLGLAQGQRERAVPLKADAAALAAFERGGFEGERARIVPLGQGEGGLTVRRMGQGPAARAMRALRGLFKR